MHKRHAPSFSSTGDQPAPTDQVYGTQANNRYGSRSSMPQHTQLQQTNVHKRKGLLDDYDEASHIAADSLVSNLCTRGERGEIIQLRSCEADRTLFWKILTILACTTLLLVLSTLAVAFSSHSREAIYPLRNVFPSREMKESLSNKMWDWSASSWLVNYHPADSNADIKRIEKFEATTDAEHFKPEVHVIPRNLVFVTNRLPGDAKIDPKTLENAAIWQELYKGTDTSKGYKVSFTTCTQNQYACSHTYILQMHFFPSAESIEIFFEFNAPQYLEAFRRCDNQYEQFDFARYVILYVLGGIAVDIAVTRPLERLDDLFQNLNPTKRKSQFIVGVDYDFESLHDSKIWAYPRQRGFATHVFAVTPKHPVLKQVVDLVAQNLLNRESEVDPAILDHRYPASVLQDPDKARLLRRMWTTGSGPLSDVILKALADQNSGSKEYSEHEVIALPMEIFMSSHPGGMRFSNIQHSRDHSHIIYMGDAYLEESNDEAHGIQSIETDLGIKTSVKMKKKSMSLTAKLLDAGIADKLQHEHGGSPANMQDAYKKQDNIYTESNTENGSNADDSSTTVRGKNYLVYDESHLSKDTHHSVAPYTYLIGAVRDASQIAETPFQYIVELSCEHGVHVHIVVGGGVEECRARFERAVEKRYSSAHRGKCGRFELLGEPGDLHALDNRVDRIAYLRDFQREHLRVVLENGHEDDVIVVADIDLYALPPVKKLMHEVTRMRTLHEYDVLCSNGLMHRPNGYYDIYATVLEPDTFTYPVKHRLLGKSWEGEDMSLVRSHDEFGEVTSWDVLDWIEKEGERLKKANAESMLNAIDREKNPLWEESKRATSLGYEDMFNFEPSSAVPVRSCFGGLTIYAATALLEPSCRYHPPSVGATADRLLKYANRDDKRPCEHVVFHDCLYRMHTRHGGRSRIAIQPDMKTMWNNMPPPRSKLISDSQQDSLITFYNQADRADRLTSPNGLHNSYVNGDGTLVIESCRVINCSNPSVREISTVKFDKDLGIEVKVPKPLKNWSHMFLILEGNGNLILLKQVPKRKLKEGGRNCGLWEDESCQLEVWSSNTNVAGNRQTCDDSMFSFLESETSLVRYELDLKDDGFLEISLWDADGISDEKHRNLIWRSNGLPSQND